MTLSVVIITYNEEANIGRTLASVEPLVRDGKGEIIVVDSGSTDRTVDIAKSHGAKVFVEQWKGFAAQKNSALEKATGDWILSLDADEEVGPELAGEIGDLESTTNSNPAEWCLTMGPKPAGQTVDHFKGPKIGYFIPRKNHFLGRWIKHGGYWPDPKMRLFRRGAASFEDRLVHEDAHLITGVAGRLKGALIHHSYPTEAGYIEHMNRYSSLGAEMVVANGGGRFATVSMVTRPLATFIYNYLFRLGFLDGREGLLLHLNHAVYVAWKYAKVWELRNGRQARSRQS